MQILSLMVACKLKTRLLLKTHWLMKLGWQHAILSTVMGHALINHMGRIVPTASHRKVCFQRVSTFTAGESESPGASLWVLWHLTVSKIPTISKIPSWAASWGAYMGPGSFCIWRQLNVHNIFATLHWMMADTCLNHCSLNAVYILSCLACRIWYNDFSCHTQGLFHYHLFLPMCSQVFISSLSPLLYFCKCCVILMC